jgi:crotonobetainyl-CoA:carnitine CoA-transferase CaiB-like acyl-CoA transferase
VRRVSAGAPGQLSPAPKIVDFSSHLSGPMASHILSELGADVIRVERPGSGDNNRGFAPLIRGLGMFHIALNSGARSLAVDRRSPSWDSIVAACAIWADAVIVGLHPDDANSRGLGRDRMFKQNQNLVYCALTGYGERGPWSRYTGHGLNMDGLAGVVPWSVEDGRAVVPRSYLTVGTTTAAVLAALGIMAALYRRDHGEGGSYVHVSSWGAAMWWNWRHLDTWASLQHPWPAYEDLGSRYGTYITSDDRAILLCPAEKKFWVEFCELLALPESWRDRGAWTESGMDFGATYDDERKEIARIIATEPLSTWVARLEKTRIPFGPLLDWREALSSEHARANHVMRLVSVDDKEVPIARLPIDIHATNHERVYAEPLSLPAVGQHNREILEQLGLPGLADELG